MESDLTLDETSCLECLHEASASAEYLHEAEMNSITLWNIIKLTWKLMLVFQKKVSDVISRYLR